MGSDTSSTSNDKEIENGRLKIKKYPSSLTHKDWMPIEWALKSNQNTERLLLNGKDRRIRAMPNHYKQINDDDNKHNDDDNKYNDNDKKSDIYNIGQLKMEFMINNKTIHCVGTGSIIYHSLNKSYVLTAAHNVIIGDDGKFDQAQSVWFQINENDELNGYKKIKRYDCAQYHVHPKYIDYIKYERKEDKGFDIAIIEVMDTENILKKIKPFEIRPFKSKMDYDEIKIIGFPGEEELCGQLYGMRGSSILNDSNKNKIRYKDIDTTGGQSGSPIFKISDNNNNNIYKSFDEIIGVHTYGAAGSNGGILINDDILQWIHNVINGDCVERNDYDCYALLITSSKTKYAKCLNEIHKKCQKTKVFNTMRLYYDYDGDDGDNVHKSNILHVVQNIFNHKNKRISYLIYFCGESDENGNWIINDDENDVITLNDIALCAKQKNYGSKVIIITDSPSSGEWIEKYKNNKQEFQTIDAIQASSKYQEVCKPGVFTSKYAQCIFRYSTPEKDRGTATKVGGATGIIVSALIVGTLYDGIIKQPIHRTTKYSQPTSTGKDDDHVWFIANDGKYDVDLLFYNSWYMMDVIITTWNSLAVTSVGAAGLY